MTNDNGKKPQEIWMLVLDNGDRIFRDFKPLKEDVFVHGITNERHHVVSEHYMVESTSCANCERLEDRLYHESRKAPEVEYKLGHEIEVLKKQLEMCRSNLIKISVRCEGGMHKQDFDRIAELTSECLAKLEKE